MEVNDCYKKQNELKEFMWELGWNSENRNLPEVAGKYNPMENEQYYFFKSGTLNDVDVIFYAEPHAKVGMLLLSYIEKHQEKNPESILYKIDEHYKEKYNYDYTYPDIKFPFEFMPMPKIFGPFKFNSTDDLKELLNIETLSLGKFLEKEITDNIIKKDAKI